MQGIELIVALLLASTVLAGLARAIHEIVEMPPDEQVRRLDALWQRLMDPDGFGREALAKIEEVTD